MTSLRRTRINEQDKQAMADYLRAHLHMGESRDELLEELGKKYNRSPRQIERYISESKKLIKSVSSKLAETHFLKLAETAEMLGSNIKKLYEWPGRYPESADIVNGGSLTNIIMDDPSSLSTPVRQRSWELERVDDYLAKCLLEHFNHEFPDMSLDGWQQIDIKTVGQDIAEKLLLLAHSKSLEFCPRCPVCARLAK